MKHVLSVLTLLTVLITSGSAQDTVQVKTGWNIIGSMKAGVVPEVLKTIPDSIITGSFFGYDPGVGYQSKDTLVKGFGYWVKVKSDGIIIFNTTPAIDPCKSKAFIYQGKLYNTVKIGNQCWMAENMNVGLMIDSLQNAADNDTIEKYCYRNDPANCGLYGGLYQWNEAMQYTTAPGTQGICPAGWHIPTYAEFQTFSSAVGGDGNALKAAGQGTGGGAGTNMSGFSALLAGYKYSLDGFFNDLGSLAYFWSSSEYNATNASTLVLYVYDSSIYLLEYPYKTYGFSVRCLED
jgi:uncharacterized protein (TIGR02145 family)